MLNPQNPGPSEHGPERRANQHPTEQREAAQALLADSSIELTTNGREAIEQAARHLPPRTRVYVPKMRRESLEDKLVQIALLHELGLEPVPHIVARQLSSAAQLRGFLQAATEEYGVKRVLVIGGDMQESGPFGDSAAVLAGGLLRETGLETVDVAGYPDGHPRIPQDVLWSDLRLKLDLAGEQGLRLNLVTQFSFAPAGIAAWCRAVAEHAPGTPVYAGIAGPTSTAQLLRYARICGVGTSLKAFNALGLGAVKLAIHARPEQQLDVLAGHWVEREAGGLAGVHVFSFGGFVESACWMERQTGAPELQTR